MDRSYIIFPKLEDKLERSGLLRKYPELSERWSIGFFQETEIINELAENPLLIPEWVKNDIQRLIEKPVSWKVWNWKVLQPDLFDTDYIPSTFTEWTQIFENQRFIPHLVEDTWTATWFFLPWLPDEDGYWFDSNELKNFKEYGFESYFDMLMSISAYRKKDFLKLKDNQYEWVNSKWIRNVITACLDGDPKFFQYHEIWEWRVISPFWNKVDFVPREKVSSMTHVYHSHEPEFFATFFRYAIELWILKKVMWDRWEKFIKSSHNSPSFHWPFWDAWMGSYTDKHSFMLRTAIPIGWLEWKYRNTHIHPYAPWNDWYLEFKIWLNKELEIRDWKTWAIIMKFLPEDCEDLLKWILHQSAHGHGRTSKKQILDLVRYYYSNEYQEHFSEL